MLSLLKYNQYKNGADPTFFITQSCLYPKKIRMTDSLGKTHFMYVPCGCCLVCQDKKRNEWVSRMSLHSLTHKFCYFVTLTYGSYNLYDYVRHPFKSDWELMKPRISHSNYKHKEIVMPTLLRQEHLTKFLKRLRALLKFNISYCAAGEYGEKYLRPHFHLIIWSDKPIKYSDVASAWSYKCYEYAKNDIRQFNGKQPRDKVFTFPIGRIDFHDLVSNGTLDFDSTQNQTQLKAKYVFSYVAKYVSKRNVISSRLRDHILQEYNRFPEVHMYDDEADNRKVIKSEMNYRTFCTAFGFEYNAHRTFAEPFTDDSGNYLITFKHNQKTYEKVTKDDFVKIFAPFFVCSRGQAIGKKYFTQNLERFQKKCFDLPKFHGKSLVFPSYFFKLLKNEEHPIYFKKTSLFSTSYSRDLLPCLRDIYLQFSTDKSIYYNFARSPLSSSFDLHKFGKETVFAPTFISLSGYTTYYFSPSMDIFEGFQFDRRSKEYVFVEYMTRHDFCEYVVKNLDEQISDIKLQNSINDVLFTFQEELLVLPTRHSVISSFLDRRKHLTEVYNIQKNQFSQL